MNPFQNESPNSAGNKKWLRGIDGAYIFLVGLIALKLTFKAGDFLELYFYDESFALFAGRNFGLFNLFTDGFVYFGWYKLLSFLFHDPLVLYAVNYAFLVSVNSFLLYIFQRKLRRGPFFSALAAIMFLVSSINIFAWPFITRFAVSLILLLFIICVSIKNNIVRYVIGLVGIFVLIWVRPEFMMSLGLYILVGLFVLLHHIRKGNKLTAHHAAAIILVITISGFSFFIKNPAATGRSVWAFGQHYAKQLQKVGETERVPEGDVDWRGILQERFGNDQSLWKAAWNNPGEMARHLINNLNQIPEKILYGHFPFTQIHYPRVLKITVKWILICLYALSFLNLIRKLYVSKRITCPPDDESGRSDADRQFFAFLLTILAMPAVFSVIVIYPRDHYILPLIFFLYVGMLLYFPQAAPRFLRDFRYRALAGVLVVLLIFYMIPWRNSERLGIWPGNSLAGCTNLKRLKMLRDHAPRSLSYVNVGIGCANKWNRVKSPKQYLEADSPVQYTFIQPDNVPFSTWLESNKINMVFIDERLLAYRRWKDESNFMLFLENPGHFGWRAVISSSCAEYVLVKNE